MGVKNLWSIIHSVCQKESLESMRGKTFCVDLSTWICQAEETLPLKHAVAKPYLRNTIFRVICLKRLGARLIFLTEGTPPELKWDVILARTNARTEEQKQGKVADARKKGRYQVQRAGKAESGNSKQVKPKRVGRSVFQRKINECAQLLRFLGLPVIKSEGEAEACCAFLNKEKYADGCITQDGDTFLYGGEVVCRNLGISCKDPHVYRYSMKDVQKMVGIGRQEMVALALLFGCDYCNGVPGVGIKTALKLLEELRGTNILDRFRIWAREKKIDESCSAVEKQVFRKAMKVEGFPNEAVINEFLNPRDNVDEIKDQITWGYPDLVNLQRFCFKHMEWPEEYTLSKVLGVATNEHLNRISRGIPLECPFTAHRLIKSRIQHGIPLCEVEWKMEVIKDPNEFWKGYPEEFITLESQREVLQCLPALVEEFEKYKEEKKAKGKKGKKKVKIATSDATTTDTSVTSSHKEDHLFDSEVLGPESDTERLEKTGVSNYLSHILVAQDDNEIQNEIRQSSKEFHSTQSKQLVKKPSVTYQTVCAKSTMVAQYDKDLKNKVACLADSFSSIKLVSPSGPCIDNKNIENIHTSSPDQGSSKILPLLERLQRRALMNKGNNLEGISVRKGSREDDESIGNISASVKTTEKDSDKNAFDLNVIPGQDEMKRFSSSKEPDIYIKLREPSRKEAPECEVSKEIDQVIQEDCFPRFSKRIRNREDDHFIVENITKSHPTSTDSSSKESKISPLKENTRDAEKQETDSIETSANETEFFPGDFDSPFSIKQAGNFSQYSINNNDTDLAMSREGMADNEICPSYEVANLTSDSLGCLLSDSVVLFDSPFQETDTQNDNKENSMILEKTPDDEKYVEMLRKRFGIVLQNTPLNSQSRLGESTPESAQSEKRDIPLTLMERLRKKSQKM